MAVNAKKVLLLLLFFWLQCSDDNTFVPGSSQYKDLVHDKDLVHGFWEATGGDTHVSGEIGLIVYNWYAIDTKSNTDSVYVTWDDGRACTRTNAIIKGNQIEMNVLKIHTTFTIVSNKIASVIFETDEDQYEKRLTKTRDNPLVLCD